MSLFDFTFGGDVDNATPAAAAAAAAAGSSDTRRRENDRSGPHFDFATPPAAAANGHAAVVGDKRVAPQENEPTPIDPNTSLRPTFDNDDSVEYVIRTDANGAQYGVLRFTTRRSEDLAAAAIAAVKSRLNAEDGADMERRARVPFTAWRTADIPVILLIPESDYKSPPAGDSEETPMPGARARWQMVIDWDAPNITDMGVFPLPYNVFAGCVMLPEHQVGYSTLLASLPLINCPIYTSVVQLMVIRRGRSPIVTTFEVIRFLAAVKLFLTKFYEDDPIGDSAFAGTHGEAAASERRRLRKKAALKRTRDATQQLCLDLHTLCNFRYGAASIANLDGDLKPAFYSSLIEFTYAYIRIQEGFFIDVVFGKNYPFDKALGYASSESFDESERRVLHFILELSSQRLDAASPASRRYHAKNFEAAMIADANRVAGDRRVALTAVLLGKLKFLGGGGRTDGGGDDDDDMKMGEAGPSNTPNMPKIENREEHISSIRASLEPLRSKERDHTVVKGTMIEVDELRELYQLCVTPGILVGDGDDS